MALIGFLSLSLISYGDPKSIGYGVAVLILYACGTLIYVIAM
jgi:hypothetical protein